MCTYKWVQMDCQHKRPITAVTFWGGWSGLDSGLTSFSLLTMFGGEHTVILHYRVVWELLCCWQEGSIHMNKLKQPLFPGGHLHQPPPSRRTHPTLHTNCSQSRNDTKTQLLPSLAKALHEEMTTLVIIVKIHSEVRLSAYNTWGLGINNTNRVHYFHSPYNFFLSNLCFCF